jgi:hypothetical protein
MHHMISNIMKNKIIKLVMNNIIIIYYIPRIRIFYTTAGETLAPQLGHVVCSSRPSDRRSDGPDRASYGHFTKKSSIFSEINPQSSLISQTFLRKKSKTFPKSTRSPTSTVLKNLQGNP